MAQSPLANPYEETRRQQIARNKLALQSTAAQQTVEALLTAKSPQARKKHIAVRTSPSADGLLSRSDPPDSALVVVREIVREKWKL